eukprot:GDKI01037048.1.p1 GENE.GDKI01037048.1~~GDKI01037048.1.p1  ORF type:complete len:359 (-),score=67.16 GDKI01037048.1:85-1161(-)
MTACDTSTTESSLQQPKRSVSRTTSTEQLPSTSIVCQHGSSAQPCDCETPVSVSTDQSRSEISSAQKKLSENDVDASAVSGEFKHVQSDTSVSSLETQCPPNNRTLFIFDWDDTILPTSWLASLGVVLQTDGRMVKGLPTEYEHELQALGEIAEKTLAEATKLGTVVFVTNAEAGWVELSCEAFMPCLLKFFHPPQDTTPAVRVLSARTAFEAVGVYNPFEWKALAFHSAIDHFVRSHACQKTERARTPVRAEIEKETPKSSDYGVEGETETKGGVCVSPDVYNFVCLGDANYEREAMQECSRTHPRLTPSNHIWKCIKFLERPGASQLCKEHKLISQALKQLAESNENLDLAVQWQD